MAGDRTAGRTTLSAEQTLLYDDDRPGLDWQTARIGAATVHWYGGAEDAGAPLGRADGRGAAQAEELLGHEMDGAVDIFVYDSRDDFFGALGPGAREWIGAATFPPLRTIFMWLGAGSSAYLETTIVHEVTHVVFKDATVNPFHEPAKWLNEGLAAWSEDRSADAQHVDRPIRRRPEAACWPSTQSRMTSRSATARRALVLRDGRDDGRHDHRQLRRGCDRRRSRRPYRARRGRRRGAGGGTGVPVDELYDAYYASFGVDEPEPRRAARRSCRPNVDKPGGAQRPRVQRGESAGPARRGSATSRDDPR